MAAYFTYSWSLHIFKYAPHSIFEKLWKNTKRDATHLKYFETFEALRESVCKAFKKYLREASYIIRVMKKLRRQANKLMLGNEEILVY